MNERWYSSLVLILAASAAVWIAGCSKRDHEPRTISLNGVVQTIDVRGRMVTVRFYSEKHDVEQTETIHVTDETEIMINGALAQLSDVREGERASGDVRITKSRDGLEFTALRVTIDRAKPLRPAVDPAEPVDSPDEA